MALKDEVLETLLQQIEEANVSVEYLSAGEYMTDGALQISCLHPYAKKVPEDRNDSSLVLRLSQGDFQMLLTGDLEKSGEDWLVEQARPATQNPLRCTILDAGHHGASNATGEALLDLAQPGVVLISCGKNNRYGIQRRKRCNAWKSGESAGIPRRRWGRYRCRSERKK